MQRAIDALGDGWEQGVRVIGKPTKGCRHCGANIRTVSEDGKVVVYRPATECCYSALEDQIRFCFEDINRLEAKLKEQEDGLEQLKDDVIFAENRTRGEALQRRLDRAEAHMPTVRLETSAQLRAVRDRIHELRAMQDDLNRELEL